MLYLWIGALVFFGIAEAATAALVSVWFIIGSGVALLCCALGAHIWVQIAAFAVVSFLALLALRPLAKRNLNKTFTPTNADRVLGKAAKVTERIENEIGAGAVYIDGKTWSARSEDGAVIEKDVMVTVREVDGVKLIVAEKQKEE